MKKFRKKKGFTLLELVIVISIIAILITIAAIRYSSASLSAQAVSHNSNVKMIKNAAVLYLNDNVNVENININDLKKYFDDGKIPKPARALKSSDFTITYSKEEDKIVVSPGIVKVENNKLVLDNNANSN